MSVDTPYRRLANRFRRGEPLTRSELERLLRFVVDQRNYALADRIAQTLKVAL